ncbi:MAG TPA: hypothetical protein VF532_16390 [Candidatus Angelobacter sp.]
MDPTRSYRIGAAIFGSIAFTLCASAAELKPKTTEAFDKYVVATEARMADELRSRREFLYVEALPEKERLEAYDRLKRGEVLVEHRETKASGVSSDVPDGMVHHWVGLVFIPGVTLAQALPVLKDYEHRAELYKPAVTASSLISHQGDDYKIFLRLYEKKFTTVAFNTEYNVHWGSLDERRLYSDSISTRIAQLKNPDNPDAGEYPVGKGNGFLWRFNTYWRYEEKDGGVYLQCEAVSLTRDIPFGFAWLIKPLVTKIPRDSLNRALGRTRQVVEERAQKD